MSRTTRRDFIRDGVAAFTVSFAAPAFLCDAALAQGAASRNLVVIYLSGGNDVFGGRHVQHVPNPGPRLLEQRLAEGGLLEPASRELKHERERVIRAV